MDSPFSEHFDSCYIASDDEIPRIKAIIQQKLEAIGNIDKQIEDVKISLAALEAQRDANKTLIQKHQALITPIKRLPPDILTTVFLTCLPAVELAEASLTSAGFTLESRYYLNLVATIGLCLFLFLVGLEIDAGVIKRKVNLTTSNILFKLEDANVDSWSDTRVYDIFGEPTTEVVTRVDKSSAFHPNAPRELVQEIDGSRFVDSFVLQRDVVLTDFGQSFSVRNMPKDYSPATIVHHTPPEFRFTQKAGLPSDIWTLACAIFEIRAGHSLFDSFLRDSDIVLMQTVETLGRLPDPW
ncbi:hypothetical protein MD484_g3456, partial [Candolleomyces efflorescens]